MKILTAICFLLVCCLAHAQDEKKILQDAFDKVLRKGSYKLEGKVSYTFLSGGRTSQLLPCYEGRFLYLFGPEGRLRLQIKDKGAIFETYKDKRGKIAQRMVYSDRPSSLAKFINFSRYAIPILDLRLLRRYLRRAKGFQIQQGPSPESKNYKIISCQYPKRFVKRGIKLRNYFYYYKRNTQYDAVTKYWVGKDDKLIHKIEMELSIEWEGYKQKEQYKAHKPQQFDYLMKLKFVASLSEHGKLRPIQLPTEIQRLFK